MSNPWNQRPIYLRLPAESEQYQGQDPPVSDWLTLPWDQLLIETKDKVSNFYRDYLDPTTAKPEVLDWLGQLVGFTGDYAIAEYPTLVKRQLIARAFDFVWINKGNRILLEWLFTAFELEARIYLLGEFLAGINQAGDTLGGEPFRYFVLLPLRYLRTSPEWGLAARLNALYGSVYCVATICYDQFRCGFSVCGDPVFDVQAEQIS